MTKEQAKARMEKVVEALNGLNIPEGRDVLVNTMGLIITKYAMDHGYDLSVAELMADEISPNLKKDIQDNWQQMETAIKGRKH